VAVLAVAAGAYYFISGSKPPPPPPATKSKAGTPAANTANLPAAANKPAQAGPTLSETQKAIAHAPVNAINKAQDAINARRGGEQARVDAIAAGEEPPAKPAAAEKAPEKPGPTTTSVASSLSPGVSAPTTEIQAAAEASAAFRTFVASAKVTGLFQGASPRVMLNGRLTRVGDTVESALGVQFDGYDVEKKQLRFKDKNGAVVTRRYP